MSFEKCWGIFNSSYRACVLLPIDFVRVTFHLRGYSLLYSRVVACPRFVVCVQVPSRHPDGSTLPALIQTNLDCSVNDNAVFNPATGDMLLEHAACIDGATAGFYLYPIAGGPPDHLVNSNGVSTSSEPAAFSTDGSVFVYTARAYSDNIQSLYAYIMGERRVVTLLPGAVGIDIVNAAFAPDNVHLVYCVQQGDAYDVRLLDLSGSADGFGVDDRRHQLRRSVLASPKSGR